MPFGLNRIGQIALSVTDVDRSEAFYENILRLRKLYRFGDLTFFDLQRRPPCFLKRQITAPQSATHGSPIYFACTDIALGVRELEQRGITFTSRPHLIAPMEDHDLWMAFFEDPDGHTLALMHEAPKGYSPGSV